MYFVFCNKLCLPSCTVPVKTHDEDNNIIHSAEASALQ